MTETLPTLRVYDGYADEVIATGPTTDIPDVPEWLTAETGGDDRQLRTYGVVHRITASDHIITVCGWEPNADATDGELDSMQETFESFYRDAPTASTTAGRVTSPDGLAGGRVYYFESKERGEESFFQHRTPTPPTRHDGVTIEGTPYLVLGTQTGVDADGVYTLVTVSSDMIDEEETPYPVFEARRNLDGQRQKADGDWD